MIGAVDTKDRPKYSFDTPIREGPVKEATKAENCQVVWSSESTNEVG